MTESQKSIVDIFYKLTICYNYLLIGLLFYSSFLFFTNNYINTKLFIILITAIILQTISFGLIYYEYHK